MTTSLSALYPVPSTPDGVILVVDYSVIVDLSDRFRNKCCSVLLIQDLTDTTRSSIQVRIISVLMQQQQQQQHLLDVQQVVCGR